MPEALVIVKNVLDLEARKGYQNTAVAGGMENFISFFNQKSSIEQISSEDREILIFFFKSYSSYSHNKRKEIIDELLGWIEKVLDGRNFPLEKFLHKIKRDDIPAIQHENSYVSGQDPALLADIQSIRGIGEKNSKLFQRLGIHNVYDLIRFYPRKYQDFSKMKQIGDLMYGEEVTIIGAISSDISTRKSKRGNLTITETAISNSSGSLRITWFNQPYLKRHLSRGKSIVVSGKVEAYLGRLVMNNPEWELLESDQLHTNRIVPVYPLTSGISRRQLRKIVQHLMGIVEALKQIHFPDTSIELEKAKRRFAFEEIYFLQLGVLVQKRDWTRASAEKFGLSIQKRKEIKDSLPYRLTNAQEKAVSQILEDLASGKPMNRLLQGDVGSGKTVVARFAIEAVIHGDAQAAVMAPTSILAEQHFSTFSEMLVNQDMLDEDEIALLTGSTPDKERKVILDRVRNGKIKLIVGTHALIEDPVHFNKLALVVIDEQHRFGVHQRSLLKEKGESPHLLIMTATPIPRSLALTIHGDLDVSVIDEMPEGRKRVDTLLLYPYEREKAYDLIRDQINLGFQAFIIYPLVESNEDEEFKAAVNEYKRLRKQVFPEFKIGLMHGRLKPDEKEKIMGGFRQGDYDLMVSTTVIEVGVDIPKATLVLIEGANRFGLAQLHQIRGRVGRNQQDSYCILIPDNDEEAENERLKAMTQTNDGFYLADLDLRLRGPGDFIGTRQSGFLGFHFASITDLELIESCREEALRIFNDDPELNNPENNLLKNELKYYWPELKYS